MHAILGCGVIRVGSYFGVDSNLGFAASNDIESMPPKTEPNINLLLWKPLTKHV